MMLRDVGSQHHAFQCVREEHKESHQVEEKEKIQSHFKLHMTNIPYVPSI